MNHLKPVAVVGTLTGVALLVGVVTFMLQAPGHHAVAAKKNVRIGVYENPPKIFYKNGHIQGIFGDLIDAIATKAGWHIVPVPCKWQECLTMVEHGKIDLMPDVALTAAREKRMEFSGVPALYSWSELYRRPKESLLTIQNLNGKRIAVLAGSVQERYLKEMIANYGLHDVKFIRTGSIAQAFQAAEQGKADAAAANYFFGDAVADKYHLRGTPIIFEPVQLYFVTQLHHNDQLRSVIDRTLTTWQADPNSSYYKILTKWRTPTGKFRIPDTVWFALILLGLLLTVVTVIMLLQRRKVLKQEHDLRFSERKLIDILNSMNAAVYIKDPEYRYQYANRRVSDLLNIPVAEMIGKTDEDLFEAETAARIRAVDKEVLCNGAEITLEEDNHGKDGELRAYLTVKQPLRDNDGRIYALCGISTDFTEHRQIEKRIHQLAFYDSLTELPNRELMLDRLQHALDTYERSRSDGALVFLDLDNFKALNDTLGHTKGDLLLKAVARRFGTSIRQTDTLARLGGDEFILIMEGFGTDNELVVANVLALTSKLRQTLTADPYDLDGVSFAITGSFGVSLFSDVLPDANGEPLRDTLLKQADMAMYAAKKAGRNQIKYFNPGMSKALAERVELEMHLIEALRQEQLYLVYQPIVDGSGCAVAAEALVRWRHPEQGEIPPSRFIPVAETTGQILPLGDWIMREACKQLALWNKDPMYRHLILAVNVSAQQFHSQHFVADVKAILEDTGANPHYLEMELTESLMAEDVDALIRKMKTLCNLGIRFSLDDFGTGYSSLSFLKRLPLYQVKIDQSFVHDLLVDPNDAAIVRTILALGRSLDLEVVAEGVETDKHHEQLQALGCQRLQGYLYARPGPPESVLNVKIGAAT